MMRILNISNDPTLADPAAAVHRRLTLLGDLVEFYGVVGLASAEKILYLSPRVEVRTIKHSWKIWDWWRLKSAASAFLKRGGIQVLTVQDPYYLGWLGVLLAHKFDAALEIQVHGFEKFRGLRKRLARRVLARADVIRTVSERLKKTLIEVFDLDGERIIVVPIPHEVAALDRKRRRSDAAFVFLAVGRLVPVKNIVLQLRAFAGLVKNQPHARLWIVGSGQEEGRLKALSRRLGIVNAVVFWGWQEDVARFYNEADAFLLTSDAEGWPLVIVEAAGHGLPIIMTDVGSAGELIIHRESGLVVPVYDEPALLGAMKEIMADAALRTRLAQGAKAAVKALPRPALIFARYRRAWEIALTHHSERKPLGAIRRRAISESARQVENH